MKKRIINIFLVLLMAAGFNSCYDEFLEPVPETVISELSAFETRERVEAQVKGIYSAYKSGQYLGGRYQVYNSIRSDLFLNLQTNGVTAFNTWNHNLDPSTNEVVNLWGSIYTAVNRVNMFIEGMEANQERILSESILSQAEYDGFLGEAYALRGLAFHHIIQLYARPYNEDPQNWGAILRITAQRSSADNDMARATLSDTYEQILSDMNLAESLLPEFSGPNSAERITRMHKGSVAALKSRVYLQMSDYNNVLTEGNKIVSASAPFTAPSGVAYALHENFEEVFTLWTTSESIISIPMTTTELPGTQNYLAHYFSDAPIGGLEYPINHESQTWLSGEFPDDDHRRLLVTERTFQGTDYLFINKYQQSPALDWAPVIRYAEVLLNLAEAEVKVNNSVNARALALLNAVFLRSNPGADPIDISNVDDFLDRVLLEREMEFLAEGIDNMDVMRTLRDFRPKENVSAVGPSSIQYVWPIPQSELNTNSLVQPNY
jgi:starch-binding outer membrane protein, SusD/RagB family